VQIQLNDRISLEWEDFSNNDNYDKQKSSQKFWTTIFDFPVFEKEFKIPIKGSISKKYRQNYHVLSLQLRFKNKTSGALQNDT